MDLSLKHITWKLFNTDFHVCTEDLIDICKVACSKQLLNLIKTVHQETLSEDARIGSMNKT